MRASQPNLDLCLFVLVRLYGSSIFACATGIGEINDVLKTHDGESSYKYTSVLCRYRGLEFPLHG